MKMLSSWFGINHAVGPVILSIAIFSAFLALAMSPRHAAPQSNSRTAGAIIAPACAASTIFSASFTAGQDASPKVQQQWRDFIQSLPPAEYDTLTVTGTF